MEISNQRRHGNPTNAIGTGDDAAELPKSIEFCTFPARSEASVGSGLHRLGDVENVTGLLHWDFFFPFLNATLHPHPARAFLYLVQLFISTFFLNGVGAIILCRARPS
jgi:hypothetical protein